LFVQSFVGNKFEILVNKQGRKREQMVGNSPWLQPVILDENDCKIGDIVEVRITHAHQNSLFGERI
jgi:tRNA-2-methylthio-N6-dimethylallyladenosine synthase